MTYGLYDTADKCWLGDEKGPHRFTDRVVKGKNLPARLIARVAATVVNQQFQSGTRFRAVVLETNINRLKDVIHAPMTGLEALKRIERTRNEK